VFFGMLFGSVLMMFGCVKRVTVRNLGMMSCFFMAAALMVLGSFPMVLGGLLMVVRSLLMMVVNIFHFSLREFHRKDDVHR
jgi:hypothetical protein